MKHPLLSILMPALALAGYHQIGVERYCNVSPAEQQISCNYESAASCLSYAQSGEQCLRNPHAAATTAANTEPSEVVEHLKKAWLQQHSATTLSFH